MKLIINDKFHVECKDGCNYNLIETYQTEAKNGFESKESQKIIGHYPNTLSALKAYVKRDLDSCGNVGEIVSKVIELEEKITKILKD
jgi:hypothetical protein